MRSDSQDRARLRALEQEVAAFRARQRGTIEAVTAPAASSAISRRAMLGGGLKRGGVVVAAATGAVVLAAPAREAHAAGEHIGEYATVPNSGTPAVAVDIGSEQIVDGRKTFNRGLRTGVGQAVLLGSESTVPFGMHVASGEWSGIRNDVLLWGYNVLPGTLGRRADTSEAMFKVGLETNYRPVGSDETLMELNWDYLSADGATHRRPLSLYVNKVRHTAELFLAQRLLQVQDTEHRAWASFDEASGMRVTKPAAFAGPTYLENSLTSRPVATATARASYPSHGVRVAASAWDTTALAAVMREWSVRAAGVAGPGGSSQLEIVDPTNQARVTVSEAGRVTLTSAGAGAPTLYCAYGPSGYGAGIGAFGRGDFGATVISPRFGDVTSPLRVVDNKGANRLTVTQGNVGLHTITQFGDGVGVVGLANAATAPTVDPRGGGVLYSEGGALKWRGSAGTVTTVAEP